MSDPENERTPRTPGQQAEGHEGTNGSGSYQLDPEELLRLFDGRRDAYYVEDRKGPRLENLPLDASVVARHLRGEVLVGVLCNVGNDGSACFGGAIDATSVDFETVRRLQAFARDQFSIALNIFSAKKKGWFLRLCAVESVPCSKVRKVLDAIRHRAINEAAPINGLEVLPTLDRCEPGNKRQSLVIPFHAKLLRSGRTAPMCVGADGTPEIMRDWRVCDVERVSEAQLDAALSKIASGNGELSDATRIGAPSGRVVVRRMSQVQIEPIDFLWSERIARGSLTIIVGDPDLGKSTITFDLAATVTKGLAFPDRAPNVAGIGSVVLLSMENSPAQVIAPRLKAAGADLSRVHLLDGINESTTKRPGFVRSVSLDGDLYEIDGAIEAIGDVQLLIVDPLQGYLGGTDSHVDAQVRQVLGPLAALAERRRIAVLAVMHTNKRRDGPALHRVGGSIGFVAAARAVFGVAKHPNDPSRRVFVTVKNNLSADRSGLSFRLIEVMVDGLAKPVPRVEWDAHTIDLSADDVLSEASLCNESSALAGAGGWLRSLLANGPVPAGQAIKDAEENGIAKRTLDRAKKALGVRSSKVDGRASWEWSLPDTTTGHDEPSEPRQ